ncbi:MAG: protein meaA [Nitrospirae bacterium]|nr:protein meaA [Nitrospirota bacterium]
MAVKDQPWIMRTYAGHSSAEASNKLYRANLAKGQTGLSIAFDLPTQIGYDPDHPLAKGEVGKVGVPISNLEDLDRLLDGIPLDRMNTSMTINATAAWLLALYIALAKKRGVDPKLLQGTTQNDIVKEYLSRGTYSFPPGPSMRLITDTIVYAVENVPKWNPINICSYHLQEAGATPMQELAYSLCNAIAVLDSVKSRGFVGAELSASVGRISFFVNAGLRFVEEMCKMRAFTEMWDEIASSRYGVKDPKERRFRYGVQVNSLGLTERQAENNIVRIAYEALGVTLSKNARARSLQLPAWNEALGLPRPWDQQLSLRLQQILAHETDLLEYPDLFDGSPVVRAKVEELKKDTRAEMDRIDTMGGILRAVETGYVKQRLVESNSTRVRAIESGDQIVVGVNKFQESEVSPLTAESKEQFFRVDPQAEKDQIQRLHTFRRKRDRRRVEAALSALRRSAIEGTNLMSASIEAAEAGVTTGEWAGVLREVFGEYRAPTGVAPSVGAAASNGLAGVRERMREIQQRLGHKIRILVGKPGLDGHSNGAEQIAVRARDAGMEVIYAGIRLTPGQIVASALQEGVDLVGLSILSGSHVELVGDIMSLMKQEGLQEKPVVVGGIIPASDHTVLLGLGVKRIYTPKDFELNSIMLDLIELAGEARRLPTT